MAAPVAKGRFSMTQQAAPGGTDTNYIEAMAGAGVACIELDADGRVVAANTTAHERFGDIANGQPFDTALCPVPPHPTGSGGALLVWPPQPCAQDLTLPDGMFGASLEALPEGVVRRMAQILNRVVAFVGVLNLDGILLEANEPALLAANLSREDVIGKPFWDCYWWSHREDIQDRLRDAVRRAAQGETVRYDSEIRVGDTARLTIDFQLAPLFDADGKVIELIPSGVDITERAAAEATRELLLNELSHRVKNTLASVQSIASHTLRNTSDTKSFETTFRGRLNAVAACHDLLVETDHSSARLDDIVRSQVGPYTGARPDALRMGGPDVVIKGNAAHPLSLVMHELATNASKYGALSVAEGWIEVEWDFTDRGLRLVWSERGGPEVAPPASRGFGSVLIERSLSHVLEADSHIRFEPGGVVAEIVLPRLDLLLLGKAA